MALFLKGRESSLPIKCLFQVSNTFVQFTNQVCLFIFLTDYQLLKKLIYYLQWWHQPRLLAQYWRLCLINSLRKDPARPWVACGSSSEKRFQVVEPCSYFPCSYSQSFGGPPNQALRVFPFASLIKSACTFSKDVTLQLLRLGVRFLEPLVPGV